MVNPLNKVSFKPAAGGAGRPQTADTSTSRNGFLSVAELVSAAKKMFVGSPSSPAQHLKGSAPTADSFSMGAAAAAAAPMPDSTKPEILCLEDLHEKCTKTEKIIGALRTLKDEIRKPSPSKLIIVNSVRTIFTSDPDLKASLAKAVKEGTGQEVTAEGIEAFLVGNISVFYTIINPEGSPLIKLMLSKHEQLLSQLKTLFSLTEMENDLTKASRLDPREKKVAHKKVKAKFNSLSNEIRVMLAYSVWERSGLRTNGMQLIRDNAETLIQKTETYTTSPLRGEILRAQQSLRNTLEEMMPKIHSRDPQKSNELRQLKVNILQIKRLEELLTTPGTEKETILTLFHEMPEDLKGFICELIWRLDGEPKGDYDYGLHVLERNPFILLHILNGERKNLLVQLCEHFQEALQAQTVKDLALNLQKLLQAAPLDRVAIEEHLRQLASITESAGGEGFTPWKSLGYLVWDRDRVAAGQANNSSFGEWGYGNNKIKEAPEILIAPGAGGDPSIMQSFLNEAERRLSLNSVSSLIDSLRSKERRETDVARLSKKVDAVATPRVAMITAEFNGILSQGGLGAAVRGMAEGLGGRNVVVIMPKYENDAEKERDKKTGKEYIIAGPAALAMEKTEMVVNGHAVWKTTVLSSERGGVSIPCYLIENSDVFEVGTGADGKTHSIYGGHFEKGDDPHVKGRFAQFQNDAARLSFLLFKEKEIDVVHVHDSQTALVPAILSQHYSSEWKSSDGTAPGTPPVVFTFHNNLSQEWFISKETTTSLEYIGLGSEHRIGFLEGLDKADAVTTVSTTFSEEARSDGILGRGAGDKVRKAAMDGKFFDILNGNTPGWDPKTNSVLKDWTLVSTLKATGTAEKVEFNDFPADDPSLEEINAYLTWKQIEIESAIASNQKVTVDLTYGPDDHPLLIEFKKFLCKKQVAEYFAKFGLGTIDPDRPLLLNFGRFDPMQKGIDKIPAIMETAHERGAQMIAIGLDGKECSHDDMSRLRMAAKPAEGLILIEDERKDGKLMWQQGHRGEDGVEIPGIGPLLRASADICIFPSEFEPCGLTQLESFLFGTRVIATETGGFADTVDKVNGWKFERKEKWRSTEQEEAMKQTIRSALEEVKTALYSADPSAPRYTEASNVSSRIAFYENSKRIMRNAKLSGWTEAPEGKLSAIAKLQHVYAFARERAKRRGHRHYDIRNPSVIV